MVINEDVDISEEKMKNCYYYLAMSPIKNRYLDSSHKKPLINILVETKSKKCNIAFFGSRKKAEISFVRITIPNCKFDKFTEKDANLIQVLKEHALSVLRFTYDVNASFYPIPFWTFHDPKYKKYKMGLSFTEKKNTQYRLNEQNIKNVFCATFGLREDFKLLSDSMDMSIPLQYRYLSLYKIIENNFKNTRGKLDYNKLNNFLKQFEYNGLKGKIIGLRDKCAHIKDNKGSIGVTQLNRPQLIEVEKFLPFLQNIIIVFLNEKGKNKFLLKKR